MVLAKNAFASIIQTGHMDDSSIRILKAKYDFGASSRGLMSYIQVPDEYKSTSRSPSKESHSKEFHKKSRRELSAPYPSKDLARIRESNMFKEALKEVIREQLESSS
jgi:hypothetical protein